MSVALALGQVEEAMGILDDGRDDCCQRSCEALVRARNFLLQAITADAARVPLAHYGPITAEEVE